MEAPSAALFAQHGRMATRVGRRWCCGRLARLQSARTISARHRSSATDHRRPEPQRLHDHLELALMRMVQAQVKVHQGRIEAHPGSHEPRPFHQPIHHARGIVDAREQPWTGEVELRQRKEPVALQVARLHPRPLPRHDCLLQLFRSLRDLGIDGRHGRVQGVDLPVERLQVRVDLRTSPLGSDGRGSSGGWGCGSG